MILIMMMMMRKRRIIVVLVMMMMRRKTFLFVFSWPRFWPPSSKHCILLLNYSEMQNFVFSWLHNSESSGRRAGYLHVEFVFAYLHIYILIYLHTYISFNICIFHFPGSKIQNHLAGGAAYLHVKFSEISSHVILKGVAFRQTGRGGWWRWC